MLTDDDRDVLGCSDCGRPIDAETERAFAITPEIVLCYECSVRRGGSYDDARDAWRTAPRLEGLPEQRAQA